MGLKSFKCTNCGHNNIGKIMSGDLCVNCKAGRYRVVEVIPDEYYNELRGRGYRLKLEELKQMLKNGQINRVQYLVFKNELDKKFPNPHVDWRRIPNKFKDIHDVKGYESDPPVKIIVPNVRMIDEDTIGISTKELDLGLKNKEGKINWQKVNEIRQKSRGLLDKFTKGRKKRP